MPQNLALGAFVLGSVLLLVSLLSGGFKIFGAEVSGTTGKMGRLIAFVLGLVFIITGFVVGDSATSQTNPAPAPAVVDNRPTEPADAHVTPRPSVQADPPASRALVNRPANVVDSGRVDTVAEPAAASVRSLDISWGDGTPELQQIIAQSPQEYAAVGYVALATGMDIYAFRVRITNTGTEPVMVSPEKIRVHYGLETVQANTMPNRQFLQAGRLQPNQFREGLIAFSARADIGAAIRLGGGNLSYEDDSVQISYGK